MPLAVYVIFSIPKADQFPICSCSPAENFVTLGYTDAYIALEIFLSIEVK